MALTGQTAVAWDPQRSFAGRKNNSQGIILVIISCQRVILSKNRALPWNQQKSAKIGKNRLNVAKLA